MSTGFEEALRRHLAARSLTVRHLRLLLERELRYRRRVYRRLLGNGDMTRAEGEHELACMEVLHEAVRDLEEPSLL